jgi:hypothetical protein
MSQEKRKIAALTKEEKAQFEALLKIEVPDFTIDNKGKFSFALTVEQKAKFLMYKYKLEPDDMYIDIKKSMDIIVIKASGWYKIAEISGGWQSETILVEAKQTHAIFKARVRKKNSNEWKSATGYCGHDEFGKDSFSIKQMLTSAETDAVIRGIRMIYPINYALSESDAQAIDQQETQETIDHMKKTAEERKQASDSRKASREEQKLVNNSKPAPKPNAPMGQDIDFPPEFDEEK